VSAFSRTTRPPLLLHNVGVSALDQHIDDLYQQPLAEFITARNALAKTVGKDEAKRVRALAKPTVVPWAVNQVYWRARNTYDRLMKSGEQLRKAQVAALEGKKADVRAASEAHRRAIADAVGEAERLAAPSGSKPAPDALMRTFEALSLATEPPDAPGRLTEALRPAGFEALAGITPKPWADDGATHADPNKGASDRPDRERQWPAALTTRAGGRGDDGKAQREHAKKEQEREAREAREREEAARQAREREAAIRKAEARLARVEAAEQQARAAWERAHDELLDARRAVSGLKSRT
jgi:hypothetical protein